MEMSTYRNVDHTPNPTFTVFLKYSSDLLGLCEITSMGIDDCTFFLTFRGVFWQTLLSELSDTFEGCWICIMVVINRDGFVLIVLD